MGLRGEGFQTQLFIQELHGAFFTVIQFIGLVKTYVPAVFWRFEKKVFHF